MSRPSYIRRGTEDSSDAVARIRINAIYKTPASKTKEKRRAAVELERMGGYARAAKLTVNG